MVYRHRLKIRDLKLNQHLEDIYELTSQIKSASDNNQSLADMLQERNADNSNLKLIIEKQKDENKSMSVEMENMFRDKWKLLNELCSKYFDNESDKIKQSLINNIEEQINKLRNKNTITEIRTTVDRYTSGLITALSNSDNPCFKPDEINLMALILSGLSPKTVCFFTGMKLKTFYTRRARLLDKVERGNTQLCRQFIQRIRNA